MCELSLVEVIEGYSLVAKCRLLLVVASHCRAQVLGRADSVGVVHRLSYPEAGGIFPDQGLNPCCLHCKVDSFFPQGRFLTTEPPGKSWSLLIPNISRSLLYSARAPITKYHRLSGLDIKHLFSHSFGS